MGNDLEKIKMVYDYAKFHIGLYTAVVGATIGIGKIGNPAATPNKVLLVLGALGVLFVVFAGVCGGVVASNVPDHIHYKYEDFMNAELSARGIISRPTKTWLWWKHTFFWLGVMLILAVSIIAMFLGCAKDGA
jgi:hypothetical protein